MWTLFRILHAVSFWFHAKTLGNKFTIIKNQTMTEKIILRIFSIITT